MAVSLTDEALNTIARVCHEANRAYCQSIGDDSQPPWEDAPDWQKESARDGVMAVAEGRVMAPRDSHANWSAQKEEDGWEYGEEKDPEAKTHPCLVPFEQLPFEQRMKDYIFFGIAYSMLNGYREVTRSE